MLVRKLGQLEVVKEESSAYLVMRTCVYQSNHSIAQNSIAQHSQLLHISSARNSKQEEKYFNSND